MLKNKCQFFVIDQFSSDYMNKDYELKALKFSYHIKFNLDLSGWGGGVEEQVSMLQGFVLCTLPPAASSNHQ